MSKISKIVLSLSMGCMLAVVLLFVVNRWSITVLLKGTDKITLEYGTEYEEEGVEARLHGSLFFKKGFKLKYTTSKIDLSKLGEVTQSYSASFMGLSDVVTRTIYIVDTQVPTISLVSVDGIYTLPGESYKEEGFVAFDNYDGNLTDKVIREEKNGVVTYKVTDSSGNTTEVTRVIRYDDPIAPELILEGEEQIILLVGTEYIEPGYTAFDNCDGDITKKVIVRGIIDSSSVGEYILTYIVKDDYGNETSIQRMVSYVDTESPQIILNGGIEITHKVGEAYLDKGYTSLDNYDGDLTDDVIVIGSVNPNQIGTYTITYEVEDSNGNKTSVVQTIYVKDLIAPIITLEGEAQLKIQVGGVYNEAGYTARDNYDGNLTSAVKVNGSVNVNKPGIYTITYSVTDSSGNLTSVKRVINCYDPIPPKLTLAGSKNITIKAGTAYTEPGYTATDNYDGNITSSVKVNGWVNIYHAGVYTITYSISDSSGNTVTDTRTVTIQAVRQPDIVKPNGKVIYLTFDDGPSKYTDKLLRILEQYNVKATFFVVNTPHIDTIVDIVNKGHRIALHTYTHQYEKLYASESAYFDDLRKIQSLVYEKTGIFSTMVRFPGGSSNEISKNYCKGIMTSLTKALHNMGYQYYDWNVSSGDAGGASTSEAVFQNVTNGIKGKDVAIVLQHDIFDYSVDAVEKIIIWGLANGYTFLPLDETSPTAHHKVKN